MLVAVSNKRFASGNEFASAKSFIKIAQFYFFLPKTFLYQHFHPQADSVVRILNCVSFSVYYYNNYGRYNLDSEIHQYA